ncbi:MAG: recombinase family protein [Sulfitobacter sp.]
MNPFSEPKITLTKAVTYCRVSSTKQVNDGDGLSSQRHRCEDFAKRKSYAIVNAFEDQGVSGGVIERPGMQNMLRWLLQQDEPHAVIIDDISRFSRDVTVHWQLRALLEKAGGHLESPSMKFGNSSDDTLIENLLASVSQHQREKIGETSANRMKSRIANGYWVFRKIAGYKYVQTRGEGKVIVRDEPVAAIVTEALEGFASGRFATQSEVQRFLEAQPEFPKQKSYGGIRLQKVTDMLTHPLYAGYVQATKWNIPLRKGRHEGLITLDTFQKIQSRLTENAYAPRRKNIAEKFALSGFVACADCDKPLRSCESRSGTGKLHAYYLCHTKGCDAYGKSIRRDVIEGEFDELLKGMRPTEGLVTTLKSMFKDAWAQRAAQIGTTKTALVRQVKALDRQIDTFLDKLGDTTSAAATRAYERKIEKLETEKMITEEKLAESAQPRSPASEKIELALGFLANPWKLWNSPNPDHRRLVLKLGFSERLPYKRNEGYRTPQTSVIFRFLGNFTENCKMVPGGGIEPPTRGFSMRVIVG